MRVHAGAYRTRHYREYKQDLMDGLVVCIHCRLRRAVTPDHQPPLCQFPDWRLWVGVLVPSCRECSNAQSGQARHGRFRPLPTRTW